MKNTDKKAANGRFTIITSLTTVGILYRGSRHDESSIHGNYFPKKVTY